MVVQEQRRAAGAPLGRHQGLDIARGQVDAQQVRRLGPHIPEGATAAHRPAPVGGDHRPGGVAVRRGSRASAAAGQVVERQHAALPVDDAAAVGTRRAARRRFREVDVLWPASGASGSASSLRDRVSSRRPSSTRWAPVTFSDTVKACWASSRPGYRCGSRWSGGPAPRRAPDPR